MTRISKWKSKVSLNIEVGPYVLKLAETQKEVISCFQLRHQVFYQELSGKTKKTKLDFDDFDPICDHLIIVEQTTQKIVGTYRMHSSNESNRFYTETEFEMPRQMNCFRPSFVELGRACIHQDHRKGLVISLLWRGIVEYMNRTEAAYLIGCSSLKYNNTRQVALVYKYFEQKELLSSQIFKPQKAYQLSDFLFWLMVYSAGLNDKQIEEAEQLIPSLLKTYIKAGAKIASYPAYDKEFNCIDFITILKKSEMNSRFTSKLSRLN